MIYQDNIEGKDFSTDLPMIISKLLFLSHTLLYCKWEDGFSDEYLVGFGGLLDDIVSDLGTINQALYRSDEPDKKGMSVLDRLDRIEKRIKQ